VLLWISSYLSCRSQRVVVNGATSQSMPVLSGVPQGSVLGPLLFLIYIDGITSIPISSGTQTVLYADDLLLFHRISWQEDFTALQRDIMAIEQWVLDNHLTFNTSKCNYMMLSRKRSPTTPFHPLMGCTSIGWNVLFNILVYFSPLISLGPPTLHMCVPKLGRF